MCKICWVLPYRKNGQLDKAGFHYEQALRLDPKHKGALEYQGELFLMLKDKASAEANYERLKRFAGWAVTSWMI